MKSASNLRQSRGVAEPFFKIYGAMNPSLENGSGPVGPARPDFNHNGTAPKTSVVSAYAPLTNSKQKTGIVSQESTLGPDDFATFSFDVPWSVILRRMFAAEIQELAAEATVEQQNEIESLKRGHRCKDERLEDLRHGLDIANSTTKLAMNKLAIREKALLCIAAISSDPHVQFIINQTLSPVV